MSARSAVHQARRSFEALMVDTAVVTRGGGAPVFDPNTGTYTTPAGTTVYTGACRVRQPTTVEAEVLFGDEQVSLARYIVQIPYDAAAVLPGDVITITDSEDTVLLTMTFKVLRSMAATYVMRRDIACEVESS